MNKVFVANRGEIALRVIRACREMGIKSVIGYSDADADSLPVRLADETVCIGPAAVAKSYLNIPNVITAAMMTGCQAVHPGYGFLAENPYIAEICDKCGLTFVGPRAAVLETVSDKAATRKLMRDAGLPVLPGTDEVVKSISMAQEVAQSIGYPVLLKAVAGGGGRGLRSVAGPEELAEAYPTVRAEAESAFGSGDIYVEKYLAGPRHVEVQILADASGHVVHLGERECSIQRRHQKLIEESPSVCLSPAMRRQLGEAAVRAARVLGYTNAGTVEFLVDRQGDFFFLEVNARIQVEHPVTEMVTGVDLVKWQLRLADGQPLTLRQEDISFRGHAIECRINAEDPERDFAPESGQVKLFVPPGGPGVRVDSHLHSGYIVPDSYDSLLGKIIVWGESREEAVERMRRALSECMVVGVKTTIPLALEIMNDSSFTAGDFCTTYLQDRREAEGGWPQVSGQ
ncbi:MAG: acetyl-CoA carboxylase biotin carboxylase subunit [Chloroflexi bacterium]|nr:acetyl-CoA carboxylase biotin carboxylase subunit [Chloroflexota bacterium]